jgi:dienelactone hydrolase
MKPGQIDVGYHAHPTGTTHEELAGIQGPLSIAAAGMFDHLSPEVKGERNKWQLTITRLLEIDPAFTTQLRHESEETLTKTGQEWQINLFSGVKHGFAVRADLSDSKQKWAKEQAFCQAVQWFDRHL